MINTETAVPKGYELKKKKPIYKKIWFWLLIIVAVIVVNAVSGGGDSKEASAPGSASSAPASDAPEAPAPAEPAPAEPAPAEPAIVVSAQEMISVLEGNALNAKNTYEGKRVTVNGFVGSIDASGDYFALDPEPDAFILTGVQVQTSEEFLNQVASFTEGQAVTVTGTVTNVGEIMGYSLEAETIE